VRFLLVCVFLLTAAVGLGGAWWIQQPLALQSDPVEVTIPPGASASAVAQNLAGAGIEVNPKWLYAWFRLSGQSRAIKAGSYEVSPGATPASLLDKLVRGEVAMRAVTLVEGQNFRELRATLDKAGQLRHDTQGLSDLALMEQLGRSGVHPEGRFFPDTYLYAKGSSDLLIFQAALQAMDQKLASVWAQRSPGLTLKSPLEALILASIVEKETGRASDRATISAVFHNRLRKGMLLQTDPSVIYGIGPKFDGNLRKRDLLADTPWNTYTRAGLPRTPIAMPGLASLLAAVQPASSAALYFVARGDGSSQFSATLQEHNRAVNRYQLGK
jgi:UPF0755 protein